MPADRDSRRFRTSWSCTSSPDPGCSADDGGRGRAPADGLGCGSPARDRAGDAAHVGPSLRRRPRRAHPRPAPHVLGGGHGPPRGHAARAGQGGLPGRGGALCESGGAGRPRARRVAAGSGTARSPCGAQHASRPDARSRCRHRRDRVAGSGGSAGARARRIHRRRRTSRPSRAEQGEGCGCRVPAEPLVGSPAPPSRWIRRR